MRRFDLLERHMEIEFLRPGWPYVRTDRAPVFRKLVAYGRVAFSTEKIAYGGTDRKFGTWPSSRARSTYYYYTTPGRTCQVFFEIKMKKSEVFTPRISWGCRMNDPRNSCNLPHRRLCFGRRGYKFRTPRTHHDRCNRHRGPMPLRSHRIRSWGL